MNVFKKILLILEAVKRWLQRGKMQMFVWPSLAAVASLIFGLLSFYLPADWTIRDPLYGYGSDGGAYWEASSHFLQSGEFKLSPEYGGIPGAQGEVYMHQRLPGYPFFLAVERVAGFLRLPFTVSLFSLLFVFVNFYASLRLLEFLSPDFLSGGSRWLPLLLVFCPPVLLYSNGVNSDFLAATAVTVFCCLFFTKPRSVWLQAAAASVAAITREDTIILLALLLLGSWIFFGRRRQVALAALAVAATLSLWSFRNWQLFGEFKPTSFTGAQLEQNYFRYGLWNASDLVRQVSESAISKKQPLLDFLKNNDTALRYEPERLKTQAVAAGLLLDSADQKIWSRLFDDYARPKISDESYYARWNSPDFLSRHFTEVSEREGPYRAAFAIDNEQTADALRFIFRHPALAAKIVSQKTAQVALNEYPLFELVRRHSELWLKFSVYGVLFFFYLMPVILSALSVFIFWKRKEIFLLSFSAIVYVLLHAVVWGGFSRYLLPAEYVIMLTGILVLPVIYSLLTNFLCRRHYR